MICKNCGSEIDDNSMFCNKCGASIVKVYDNTSGSGALKEGNIVGFILGLVSIIAWLLPFIGFPVTIVGLVFSIINIKSSKKTLNIVGTVLCSIFLFLTLINSILGIIIALRNY